MNSNTENIETLRLRLNLAKQFPSAVVWTTWNYRLTGSQYQTWFRKCLNEKINRTLNQTGRKHDQNYSQNLLRDARIIRDNLSNRGRMSGRNILSTPELKRRYPAIDNPEN